MSTPTPRAALVAAVLTGALALAGAADAQLPLQLPSAPAPVSTVTSTVGGVVTGTTQQVTGTVDQVLSGTTGVTLPTGTLDQLLGSSGVQGKDSGGTGTTTSPGTTGGGTGATSGAGAGGGATVVDVRAPKARVTLLSRLRRVGRTGKLRLRISLDEPGIVALRGTLKPGLRRKLPRALRRQRYSRRSTRIPSTVLAYRRAGSLTVTIAVSRTAERMLNRARDARLDLRLLAADVARNQAGARVLRHVRR
ncbi:MAG TPA: hypothetical protein VFT42_05225 [Solirubrobacteraceae bacterium]|nr:hypothetical protein [Solirubrobacteraceae bacterium]